MARDTMSLRDFFTKVSWEGGFEGAVSYGLNPETDLSAEDQAANPELVKLWKAAAASHTILQQHINANFREYQED